MSSFPAGRLKENLNDRFRSLGAARLETLADLINRTKSKPKLEALSKASGIDITYLTHLKREANAYLPNPVALNKFPGVDHRAVLTLEKEGIKTSKHLFDRAASTNGALTLPDIERTALEELLGLSDLVRLYGVGPAFARMLYDLGITSASAFMGHRPEEIVQLYEEVTQKKADFTANDIRFALDIARHGFRLYFIFSHSLSLTKAGGFVAPNLDGHVSNNCLVPKYAIRSNFGVIAGAPRSHRSEYSAVLRYFRPESTATVTTV